MTIEDMNILEHNHEQAVRELQNLATNIVEWLMAGGEFTTMQQLAYRDAKKKVLQIKRDLAKALEDEFEGVIYG